jgi:hypothetical protein
MWAFGRRDAGFSLLEVVVSLQVLVLVVLVLLPVNRLALGVIAQSSALIGSGSHGDGKHPARLRTLAVEYVHAKLEYLRSRGYELVRSAECTLASTQPVADAVRLVPPSYIGRGEPRVPPQFARARVQVQDEEVYGVVADGCRPRRVVVSLYRTEGDAAADRPFARAATVLAPRDRVGGGQ